ncbi:MAG: hypothetical protein K8L99_23380, partial [Anaerolineae bacterium]|nr:hypothetical protein [Anaerolineae bacterium]
MADASSRFTTHSDAKTNVQARAIISMKPMLLLGLLALLVGVFLFSLAFGSVHIPLEQIITVLT